MQSLLDTDFCERLPHMLDTALPRYRWGLGQGFR